MVRMVHEMFEMFLYFPRSAICFGFSANVTKDLLATMPPLSSLHHGHKRLGQMIAIILRIFHMLSCKAYVTYSVHAIISFT